VLSRAVAVIALASPSRKDEMPNTSPSTSTIHFPLGLAGFASGDPDAAGDDDQQGIVALAGGDDPAAGGEAQFGDEAVEAVELIVRELAQDRPQAGLAVGPR
jgi:hypothetical protein